VKNDRAFRGVQIAVILVVIGAIAWRWHADSSSRQWRDEDGVWRPATTEERKAAITSIKAQLDAFRRNDYDRAVFYQSSNLRRQFPSVAIFRRTIKSSYPQFADYKTVDFGHGRSTPDGSHLKMRVWLTGRDGVTVRAVYLMVLEEKVFRVDGVIGGIPPEPERPSGLDA